MRNLISSNNLMYQQNKRTLCTQTPAGQLRLMHWRGSLGPLIKKPPLIAIKIGEIIIKYFLGILFPIIFNMSCLAKSNLKQVILSLDEVQANAIISVVEYYKNNYSVGTHSIVVMDNGSDFIFYFQKEKSKMQKGGGVLTIKITYSKKMLKITDVKKVFDR